MPHKRMALFLDSIRQL